MSNSPRKEILLPPGRIVQGNLYKAQDKDFEGRPRVYPQGHQKAGQPKISYFFAVAIAKTPGVTHWGSEAWGADIWAFGHAAWPNGQAQSPSFAWKIEDGDSQTPNKVGKKNCDREGFPGHWVVNLSSSFAPKIYTRDSAGRAQELLQPDAVKPGYFVQVQATIASNETQGNPGIYINHDMVMLVGYGAEIRQGSDPNAVKWATGPLPAGASAAPVGGTMPAAGGAEVPRAMQSPPPPPGAPAAPAAAPTPVTPAPSFLAGAGAPAAPPAPGAPAAPPAPPAPPAASAGPVLTAKANGASYAQMIAAGWTDATLRQHGYMA